MAPEVILAMDEGMYDGKVSCKGAKSPGLGAAKLLVTVHTCR